MNEAFDGPFAFGVHASTGHPLTAEIDGSVSAQLEQESRISDCVGGPAPRTDTFAVPFGYDMDDLSDVGWGIVFEGSVDPAPFIEALGALLALRQQQADKRFRIFSGIDGYRKGESASKWLNRHGATLNLIDPANDVPFYLTLVGPPDGIPFDFQYSLDIVAGVGRLDFNSLDEYRNYAQSVVSFEQDHWRFTRREIDLFATCHDFDRATQLFNQSVAIPLSEGDGKREPLGRRFGFNINAYLQDQSTKATLKRLMTATDRPASILFTGTHGMAFNADDVRQASTQGALVCQDWPGYGNISSDHWFAASDVPDKANVHGLIHFFFACYGAGTPEFDNFSMKADVPGRLAERALTARLPQRLLSLAQGGALASMGHVDRAWASSFRTSTGQTQTQGFRDIMGRLMSGQRIGQATDTFNNQWGVLSTELISALNDKAYGKLNDNELLALRTSRDDLRNYVVLGDPAVKLKAASD
ncbi:MULTISPECIES: C25 family cysteine peptidase [Pseudomonas]|uniref:C25 family cysteine peptidase n=1 Tax=Pseudomonas TaxID=286 RepID=UPI001E49DB8C|nr:MULTISPECIES: C25 family cysteine peptidase [Pseudomonas]MCE1116755.1 C25 family cysteine peptidase [Pseudomonas sp. NMI795_08]